MPEEAFQLRREYHFAKYLLGGLLLTPLAAAAMFILPPILANVLLLALNLVALLFDRRFGLINPVTYVLIATATCLLAARLILPGFFDTYFFPTIIFGVLFAMAAGLLLVRQPFTNFLGTSLGDQRIHYASSMIWTVGYLFSAMICLAIPTMFGLYFVPPLVMAICAALTLWLQIRYDPRIDIALDGTEGDMVRRLPSKKDTLREMYLFFAQNRMSNRRDRGNREIATAEEMAETRLAALSGEKLSMPKHFVSKDEKGIKGSIFLYPEIDGKLSTEEMFPDKLDFGKLRRYGRTAEIGQFGIRKDARRSKELPMALMSTVLTQALALDVKLIIIFAYPDSEPLYLKLGCEVLMKESVITPDGFPAKILFLNLERRIFEDRGDVGLDGQFQTLLDERAVDLFAKRAALRGLFFPRSMKDLSTEDIRGMGVVKALPNSKSRPLSPQKVGQV